MAILIAQSPAGPVSLVDRGVVFPRLGRAVGSNLCPMIDEVEDARGPWIAIYANWRWEEHIQPSLDAAASIGCNIVRVMGGVYGALTGAYTRATYHARLLQLLDYCRELGMLVYPTAFAFDAVNAVRTGAFGYSFTWAQLRTESIALADFLADHLDVVLALDVCSELDAATTFDATDKTECAATVVGCQAAAPNLPVTVSFVNPAANYLAPLNVVDFYDVHSYPSSGTPNPVLPANSTVYAGGNHNDKPFIVGEFGAPQSHVSGAWTPETRQAYAADIRDTLHPDPRCIGTIHWCLTVQDDAPTNDYGLFDLDFNLREGDIGEVLQTFSKRRWPADE